MLAHPSGLTSFELSINLIAVLESMLFWILNIIWRETKARLSTHTTQKSKMASLFVDVACVLNLAFVFAPNNINNPECTGRKSFLLLVNKVAKN